MIIFGLRITAEYHNHYLTMYQKAATASQVQVQVTLIENYQKKKEILFFPCFVPRYYGKRET